MCAFNQMKMDKEDPFVIDLLKPKRQNGKEWIARHVTSMRLTYFVPVGGGVVVVDVIRSNVLAFNYKNTIYAVYGN